MQIIDRRVDELLICRDELFIGIRMCPTPSGIIFLINRGGDRISCLRDRDQFELIMYVNPDRMSVISCTGDMYFITRFGISWCLCFYIYYIYIYIYLYIYIYIIYTTLLLRMPLYSQLY